MQYDESRLLEHLRGRSRSDLAVFAAGCAEVVFPLFDESLRAAQGPQATARARFLLDSAWQAASAPADEADLGALAQESEAMVPHDDESPIGENAGAAVCYALRCWATGDPQEAIWGARQLYDLADFVVLSDDEWDMGSPGFEQSVAATPLVQFSLQAIDQVLHEVLRGQQYPEVQRTAAELGARFASLVRASGVSG